ncbi:hypothetical protein COCOBI_01-4540 [Coccomyxa sp. Obi]|nr:hypothetical protein COCOBI_01-4540 [Coccomyxa sp. Obi]
MSSTLYYATPSKYVAGRFESHEFQFVDAALQYGRVDVSEGYDSVTTARMAYRESNEHIAGLAISEPHSSADDFLLLLSGRGQPLLFLPGFKTNFLKAILQAFCFKRAAKHTGPLVVFSWPSGETLTDYEGALARLRACVGPVRGLMALMQALGFPLFAGGYSMGGRLLAEAVPPVLQPMERAHRLLYAAADILQDRLAQLVESQPHNDTVIMNLLLGSKQDGALRSSKRAHTWFLWGDGGGSRAGDISVSWCLHLGDTVDCTGASSTGKRHNYLLRSGNVSRLLEDYYNGRSYHGWVPKQLGVIFRKTNNAGPSRCHDCLVLSD